MIAEFSKRSRRVIALSAATFLTPFALVGAAHAADTDAAADPAPAAADGGGLGDIVVTATRRSESVQKVPISMQALSMEKMAERNVKGLSDFAALMPSVSFAGLGPGRQTAYFRGIVPAGGNYASVGYYLDDIPITGTSVPDIFVYDMERVEGLSGPQGTLYGAGSLAGTIRLLTNKPKLGKFEWGYDTDLNKYGKGAMGGQLATYANIPFGDKLAARVVAFYRKEGGYIDNTPNNGKFNNGQPSTLNLGDTNPLTSYTLDNSKIAKKDYNPVTMYGGRLSVLWEPTPGWQITPQLAAQSQTAYGYFGYDPRVGDLQVHDYDLTRRMDSWYQGALSVHGHIGDFDVVSSTGYFGRKVHLQNDYTYYTVTYDGFGGGYESYLQFFDKSGCTGSGSSTKCTTLLNPTQYYEGWRYEEKLTQELRFSTPKSWPFDATFGGFYQWQKTEVNNDYGIHGLGNIAGYTQACAYSVTADCSGNETTLDGFGIPTSAGGTMVLGTPAVKRDAYYLSESNTYTRDAAIFAEAHYNLTPKLKITGGIRYFWTDLKTVGFGGVAATAHNTTTTLNTLTGTYGCPTPLPANARLTCLNTNMLDPNSIGRYKEQGETHKIAINYQLTPTKMIYANYSTGFRPGGFNRPLRIRRAGLPTVVASVDPYKSETLTNYEIGFKTTWNNIFRFNAAIYMEDWSNIQYSVVIAGTQGAGMTGNAGKARVYGVEYDADLKLGKVTVSTSGAYNNAKLTGNFCNFAVDMTSFKISQLASCAQGETTGSPPVSTVAAVDGTRLPRQPMFKGTTSVRYDTTYGDYKAYLMAAALYQTNATQDLNTYDNSLLGNTAGFTTFDFTAGIKKDTWSLDIYLQNAFDKRGGLTTNTFCSITFCSGSSRTFPVRPQIFGIKFGQKF
ncbi:TonB-dependent receptor [Novosphingobium humi]|uniref:TonB-dependent receptor n=1 Tax=Novosphingobium humi TaxID=2282397 RepID=UPI0025B1A515|nr:TonB-dependent receptor [Novosphingobium humi]WJS98503.1 TonB-dependent receptor [Novosphingobium humi]